MLCSVDVREYVRHTSSVPDYTVHIGTQEQSNTH